MELKGAASAAAAFAKLLLDAEEDQKSCAAIDNYDRAECLELINSADEWMAMRNLMNQRVHEYVEAPLVLTSALQMGHVLYQR